MHHTTFDVPFDALGLIAEARSVLVFGERVALRFDRDSHAAMSVPVPSSGNSPLDDPAVVLPRHGLREERRWTSAGYLTALIDEAGNERAVLRGELRALAIAQAETAGGDVYAAVLDRGEAHDSVVGRLGAAAVVLGSSVMATPAAADGELVAVTTESPLAIHLVKARGDGIARISIPLLHDRAFGMVLAHGHAYCLSKRALDVVATNALPWAGGDASLPARFAPFVPRGAREALPATVVMIVGTSILLDHPRLGRLRVVVNENDPFVEKGDEVVLEDVLEKLPGVYEVRRWRRDMGVGSSRPVPARSASSLPPPLVTPREMDAGAPRAAPGRPSV